MGQQFCSLFALPVLLSGDVGANRFVSQAGAQAGADAATMGVARMAGVTGERVTVDVLGTAAIETGAAVAKGDTLKSDSSGRAIPWATSGAKVAIAQEAATGAGQFVEALLIPNAV